MCSYPKPLEHVGGWPLDNEGMDDQCVIDVDEECNLFISLQLKKVHSFQLGSSSYILFKLATGTNTLVVNCLMVR